MIRFIADIGSNHNDIIVRAKRMIDDLAQLNFWGVKFQMFKTDGIWKNKTLDKRMELKKEWLPELKEHCKKRKIKLGVSVFYEEAINEAKQYVDFFKISSFDIDRISLIWNCMKTKKELMISTGLLDDKGLSKLIRILRGEYNILYAESDITWLHCVSKYPTALKEVCMDRMLDIGSEVGTANIGYSDHTGRFSAILAAMQLGAKTIELHYDRDDKLGLETMHGHCWTTSQLSLIMNYIIDIEIAKKGKFKLTKKQIKQKANKITGLRG